jgi:error-prone DNA polymerase
VPSLTLAQLEALATAGAFEQCFGLDRRAALWQAGAVAQSTPDRLAGVVTGVHAPPLPGMEPREASTADLWSTGVSAEGHPTLFVRDHLDALGVVTAAGLRRLEAGTKALVGGVVTHRQRPATAQGTTFINLEDETGFVNVVVSKGCWARYRRAARSAPALLVRGRVEKESDVINVVAERIDPLPLGSPIRSRDFR